MGNFELEFDDGEVRFKVHVLCKGVTLTAEMIKRSIRSNVKWSLLRDVANDQHPETAIREIAKAICKEAITTSNNPFFPVAAESLISAIWIMAYRHYKDNLPANDVLIKKTKSMTREQLLNEASREVGGVRVNDDLYPTINELTDPNGGVATANTRQEMERILDQAFNPEGNFCSKGDFSVINFVRNSRGRRLFLIYDFATAESSRLIIGTLLNLMMKESLSINAARSPKHRTYYYLDELPVLPDNITYLQSLCCFGRGAGNRVIVGIQGLSQLYNSYGEDNGNAILAAFTDNIIMRANDPITVEKISRRSGQKQSHAQEWEPHAGASIQSQRKHMQSGKTLCQIWMSGRQFFPSVETNRSISN